MFRPILATCFLLAAGAAMACTRPDIAATRPDAVLAEVNSFRQSKGLHPLVADGRLQAAAAEHACDSAARGRMGHSGSDGSTLSDRVLREGYRYRTIAENVAMGYPDARAVTGGWAESRGHRRNMLMRDAEDAGVGVAADRNGRLHWVLVLGRD